MSESLWKSHFSTAISCQLLSPSPSIVDSSYWDQAPDTRSLSRVGLYCTFDRLRSITLLKSLEPDIVFPRTVQLLVAFSNLGLCLVHLVGIGRHYDVQYEWIVEMSICFQVNEI